MAPYERSATTRRAPDLPPKLPVRALRAGRSLLGYFLGTAAIGLLTLLLVPAYVLSAGASAWGAIAVSQSLGALAAVIVGWGWPLDGPVKIARHPPASVPSFYFYTVRFRLTAIAATTFLGVPLAITMTGVSSAALAAASFLSTATIGLTSRWLFVGLGKPYTLLLLELTTRVLSMIVAVGWLYAGGDVVVALTMQSGGNLLCFVATSVLLAVSARRRAQQVNTGREPLQSRWMDRNQLHNAASLTIAALFTTLPVVVVGFVAPQSLASFALVDRVLRQVTTAISPLSQWIQQRSASIGATDPLGASRSALRLAVATSGVLVLTAYLLGGPAFQYLGAGEVAVTATEVLAFSLLVGLLSLDLVLSRSIVPIMGLAPALSRGSAAGFAIGVVAAGAGARFFGAVGGLLGVALGLCTRVAWVLVSYGRATPRMPVAPREASPQGDNENNQGEGGTPK